MKPINITEQDKEQIRLDFMKALETARLNDGSFSFTRSFASRDAKPEERAILSYSAEAYLKMLLLVQKFDTEIGWHGLIRKIGDRHWYAYDVLVYDQMVTGATVNTDQEGYVRFLAGLTEEQSQDMFFHGHSHVNMAVFPSSTDMNHRDGLVNTADPDKTWIFQIWNKKGEISTAIYDIPNNILYETKDIDLNVAFEFGGTTGTFTSDSFVADARACVKKVFQPATAVAVAAKPVKKEKKPVKKDAYQDYDDLIDDGTRPYGVSDYYPQYYSY